MLRIKDILTNLLTSKNEDPIENADILKENEKIYNNAYEELQNRKHKPVLTTLLYFIENDLYLRRHIAKVLHVGSSEDKKTLKEISDEILFAQHVELQSYYNSFRTLLMSDVVAYLVKAYNNVGKNIENYDVASTWYIYSERVNEFYISSIKREFDKHGETDEHLIKIYREAIDAFEEVKKLSYRTIRKLMKHSVESTKPPRTLFIDTDLE